MLGSHVSAVGGLHRAFDQASEWKCECIQIYSTPSRSWAVPALSAEQRSEYETACKRASTPTVLAHVPFLVNLSAETEEAWERSRDRLVTEIERATDLGIRAVIVHPGAAGKTPRDVALQKSARAVRDAVERTEKSPVQILIENMAGQGTTLCARFDELGLLLALVGSPERVGVCFDTAHAFIAGYPLAGEEGYRDVLGQLDSAVGISRVAAVHLNDSQTAQGSHSDRHAAIGRGMMGLDVFRSLVTDARLQRVPKIMEPPDHDTEAAPALALLRELQVSNRLHGKTARAGASSAIQLELG